MASDQMLSLKCQSKECFLQLRVGRVLNRPVLYVGELKFCPMCGKQAIYSRDEDMDYWETLAAAYGVPVNIMKMLHDTWNVREHVKFKDHVAEIMKEVEESVA